MIISSCTAAKDDTIPIPADIEPVKPIDYIRNETLLSQFNQIRQDIFSDPRSQVGGKTTFAFNLYIRKGRAYKMLLQNYYESTLAALNQNKFEWLFLSGGYGLIHALEESHSYQATFSQGIAYQNKIPYTGSMWKHILPNVIDSAINVYDPEKVLVFGSRDYTSFIKASTKYRSEPELFEINESYGQNGANTLSPKIAESIQSII